MHKKSIEAAEKLKEEDDLDPDLIKDGSTSCNSVGATTTVSGVTSPGSVGNPPTLVNKEELRSESIASLRAKAQSYQAKIQEAVHGTRDILNGAVNGTRDVLSTETFNVHSSGFEPPTRQSDSCDSDTLDPAN